MSSLIPLQSAHGIVPCRTSLRKMAASPVSRVGTTRGNRRSATSAPILARSGFTRYATWDKYAIPLIQAGGRDLP